MAVPPSDAQWVLKPGVGPLVRGLLRDVGFDKPLSQPSGTDLLWSGISIDRSRVVMVLSRVGSSAPIASLVLARSDSDETPSVDRSASFTITRQTPAEGAVAVSNNVKVALDRAIASIKARDNGGFWQRREHADEDGPRLPPWARLMILAGLLLLIVAAVAWRLRAGSLQDSGVHLKTTHFLPFAVQFVVIAYWALYWRELPGYLPQILLQIVFAYALDAAIAMVKDGRYKLTAGPLPIVGSINLFIQFPASEWPMQYGAIALAMLSKSLLTSRGRHVVNPSALGICIIGLLNLAWPQLGNGDIAHPFDLPPNMAEVILLVALVVQVRVPVVLVSLACVVGLLLHAQTSPQLNFSPFWSPVTLVVVLLATDPATSPRTGAGRVIYGLVLGLMMGWTAELLTAMGHHDFYGKILPLPLCNAMVPQFDRLAAWLSGRVPPLGMALDRRSNLAHVAVFVALMAGGLLMRGKPAAFSGIGHRYNQTRFVHWQADGRAVCEDNALFCDGFTFVAEVRCWGGLFGPSEGRCGSGRPRLPGRR